MTGYEPWLGPLIFFGMIGGPVLLVWLYVALVQMPNGRRCEARMAAANKAIDEEQRKLSLLTPEDRAWLESHGANLPRSY